MPLLKKKRKRSRPSSTSGGDEMCTSWYSTDPKHLPPGFTVGSMSVPYPPPYYSQGSSSDQPRKKKRVWKKPSKKSRKSKSMVESTTWKFVPDITRLQHSRALDQAMNDKLGSPPPVPPPPLDDVPEQSETSGSVPAQPVAAQPISDKPNPEIPILDCVCPVDPDPPTLVGANNVAQEEITEKEDATEKEGEEEHERPSPQQPDDQANIDPTVPQALLVATATGSPGSRKRLTLQRSCSMNDLDDFLRQEEKSPPPKPKRASKQVEGERKPRGISFDDTQVSQNSTSEKRPFLTHQPRSHQLLLTRSKLASYSSSPDQNKKSQTISKKTLYKPKNVEVLIETIRMGIDVNTLDETSGNAPIHAIVTAKRRRDRTELLLALLVYGKVIVDLPNRRKMPALHLAVEECDEMCIRALLAFGADVNAIGRNNYTPLDLAMDKATIPNIEVILIQMGAKTSSQLIRDSNRRRGVVPRLYSFAENMKPPPISEQSRKVTGDDDVDSELANQQVVMEMYRDLEVKVNQKFSLSASYTGADESPDDAYALLVQQRELNHFNKTLQKSGIGVVSGVEGGSRILFLDGGGIKGLVQLEVLMQLEAATGRKVTDLFDWIVGTSTGGVIALTLVYGKKSLREIFQLYFMMKDRIFSKSKLGFGFNTEVLEEILQEYLDPDIKMTDVTHPKVLISAVKKATTNLELHFFNNCFGDEYMDYPVWKVARYTSATPMFFSECDNYIDGGVICNNPTEYGLTTIQNFFRQQGKKLPIALVVSIGTGVYPAVELGSIDLFLGIQTLTRIKQRTQNLISLLGNALVESEMVATNSQSRCKEQGIPFYRFSPKLKDVIAGSETDNEKLFNMVIQTRIDTRQQGMEELVGIFHTIARASHHLAPRVEEERDRGEKDEQPKQTEEERGRNEKEEASFTNLNHQANRFLQVNLAAHSSNTMLSDIEESLEASSKKSYKLWSGSSPIVPTRFVLGELVSAAASVTRTASESEEEVDVHRRFGEQVVVSLSTTSRSEERSDLDSSTDQSVGEKSSKKREHEVSSDNPELTDSQSSSVFLPDVANSNESPAFSSPKGEDDFDISLDRIKSKSPPKSSLESSTSSLDQVSKELEGKGDNTGNGGEPSRSLTPPPPLVEEEKSAEVCSNFSQSSASPPTPRNFSSQETLKDTVSANSLVSSGSQEEETSSFGFEVAPEEEEEEILPVEERVHSDQNPQVGQDKDEVDNVVPDSAVDGIEEVEESIPGRDSHSLPISPESPQMNGPPMSGAGVGGVPGDVAAAAVTTNGHSPASKEDSPPDAEFGLHSEAQPAINGHIPHSQVYKVEKSNAPQLSEREEMPNHYKLDVRLTPDTQKETECKFPYRYETEI